MHSLRSLGAGIFSAAIVMAALCFGPSADAAETGPRPLPSGPSKVRIVEDDGRYQLRVNGEAFYVKGAGLEGGSQEALAARGGNSFRTWRTGTAKESGKALLDRAARNGLFVALGIDLRGERHGFDYDDEKAVARELERIRAEVMQFKDHPALLVWVVGNELNLESSNPAVWDAVDKIAEMIHQVDPDHPVMTTLAGIDRELIDLLKARAGALDLIGIQVYGDIDRLPEKLQTSGWTGPYIVTEWGPTGHWESPTTSWDAPIEDDSTRKASLIVDRYQDFIASEQQQCLGSYVFLWGNKQERTPTWYGLFLASGEATASVDAMQYLWTGSWPENRSPAIGPIELDSRLAKADITLVPDGVYQAHVQATDGDGDALDYRWKVLRESSAKTIGGDPEEVPRLIEAAVVETGDGSIRLSAPSTAGAYRLFVEVRDGQGHAAYANLPFRVAAIPAPPSR